jgi:hypothetical protein
MAYLNAHGLRTELAPFSPTRPESILEPVERLKPPLGGLSRVCPPAPSDSLRDEVYEPTRRNLVR